MAVFDTWVAATGLSKGVQYRLSYKVVCLNAVSNADVAKALDEVGIVTASPGISGPITGATTGNEMTFSVKDAMSISEFTGKLVAAFTRAGQGAWVDCSTPEVEAVEYLQQGSGVNPASSFGLGAAFALVLIAIVAVMIWRVK